MSIKVDDINTWPKDILDALGSSGIRRHFERAKSVEGVYNISDIRAIGSDLVKRCYESKLIGYHCTKEKHPGFFKEHGLELTDPERKVTAFLEEFGTQFSESKLGEVKRKFADWLDWAEQMMSRRGKIWFCLTRNAVMEPGTEMFFKYYGGEIIYWPFADRDTEVEALLERIGSPVVIELALDPSQLQYFGDDNLASSMLSYYGVSVNPSFNAYNIEGYAEVPLPPESIVEVHPQHEFFEAHD
jgi:hypothetical protein